MFLKMKMSQHSAVCINQCTHKKLQKNLQKLSFAFVISSNLKANEGGKEVVVYARIPLRLCDSRIADGFLRTSC